jgi:hypothetical protein
MHSCCQDARGSDEAAQPTNEMERFHRAVVAPLPVAVQIYRELWFVWGSGIRYPASTARSRLIRPDSVTIICILLVHLGS